MFWEKFVELCNEKGLAPNNVCAQLGFSTATATKWKHGSEPRSTTLKKITDYFEISSNYFEKEEKPTNEGEPIEDTIIYHRDGHMMKKKLTKEQMDMLAAMLEAIPEVNNPDL